MEKAQLLLVLLSVSPLWVPIQNSRPSTGTSFVLCTSTAPENKSIQKKKRGAGGGGGNGKLGGNPPSDFDGNRALVDTFINEFNLYCLSNIDAEQMMNLMKRAALMLGFIKGPNVKDWTKCWTNWMVREFTTGRPTTDEHYWSEVARGFQIVFQDTGARERAEDKLCHLAFIPNEVDTFITQFESLATEATYNLDAQPTMSLYASKLPYKMVDHIYKVVRPVDFQGWAEATRQ